MSDTAPTVEPDEVDVRVPDPLPTEPEAILRALRQISRKITSREARLRALVEDRYALYEAGLAAGLRNRQMAEECGVGETAVIMAVQKRRKRAAASPSPP